MRSVSRVRLAMCRNLNFPRAEPEFVGQYEVEFHANTPWRELILFALWTVFCFGLGHLWA